MVSTGTAFGLVALRTEGALARLKVKMGEATSWLRARGARWFYVVAPADRPSAAPEFCARMQFEGGEDPATGSAAGCAISFLVRHGAVQPGVRVHLRQGVEVHRPSDLYLTAGLDREHSRSVEPRVVDVRVAGSTVPVATGRLFLP